MVWTVPWTWVKDDVLTAAQLNIFLRDNFLETEVAKATAAHRLIVTSGTHQVSEGQFQRGYVGGTITVTAQFPSSEESDDQQSAGPEIEAIQHYGRLLCLYDAKMKITAGNGNGNMAPGIDGTAPDRSLHAVRSDRTTSFRTGSACILEAPPGISRVTMYYGVSRDGVSCEFSERRLMVIPI